MKNYKIVVIPVVVAMVFGLLTGGAIVYFNQSKITTETKTVIVESEKPVIKPELKSESKPVQAIDLSFLKPSETKEIEQAVPENPVIEKTKTEAEIKQDYEWKKGECERLKTKYKKISQSIKLIKASGPEKCNMEQLIQKTAIELKKNLQVTEKELLEIDKKTKSLEEEYKDPVKKRRLGENGEKIGWRYMDDDITTRHNMDEKWDKTKTIRYVYKGDSKYIKTRRAKIKKELKDFEAEKESKEQEIKKNTKEYNTITNDYIKALVAEKNELKIKIIELMKELKNNDK